MENVWAILKANVSYYQLIFIKDFIKIIKKNRENLIKYLLKFNVFNKNRISLIINNKNNQILY